MRTLTAAVLALAVSTPLFAAAPRATVALGVGASSASEIIVKIDGKDTHVKLAGVPADGTYAGQAFLQCLVADRVVRVDRGAGRVTMLDGTSVADHLAEFLQTRTQSDPCMLGKAAYVSVTPRVAAAPAAAPGEPVALKPGLGGHEVHVSFASGEAKLPSTGAPSGAQQPQQPARPASKATPTGVPTNPHQGQIGIYQPLVVGSQPMTQAGTTTLTPGSTESLSPGQPYNPQTTQTTTIPTYTTQPPPPPQPYNPPL